MNTSSQSTRSNRFQPEIFYGYCHRQDTLRMMNLDDYLDNIRQSYALMQGYAENLYRPYQPKKPDGQRPKQDCKSECNEQQDCHCECCICDADAVIEARCGERRLISISIENESRRTRQVNLSLSDFATADGHKLNWAAALSESQFTLGPCEKKTISLIVTIDCRQDSTIDTPIDNPNNDLAINENVSIRNEIVTNLQINNRQLGNVERCEVAYANIIADGALYCPIRIAVAVLPNDCDSLLVSTCCDCC